MGNYRDDWTRQLLIRTGHVTEASQVASQPQQVLIIEITTIILTVIMKVIKHNGNSYSSSNYPFP